MMRISLVAAAGALSVACGGISDCKEDVAKCSEMLRGNTESCAIAFKNTQGDPKRKFCEQAIKVVSKAKAKDAVPGLIGILSQPESSIPYDQHREEAAKALASIGDPAAVDALVNAISVDIGTSGDPLEKNTNRTNEAVAEALGELKAEKACGKLTELMKKSRADYAVLKSIRSLGEIGCKESVQDVVDVALNHPNKFMRKNAVMALGDIGDERGTAALVQMMFIEYQGVSFYPEASFSLFQIGPKVSDALLDTMAGKNEAVNKYFQAKGGLKDTAVKAKCGFVLGDLRDPRAVDALVSAFESAVKENDPVLLIYSASPLGALGDKKAVPVLAAQMADLDASKRDPLMRALVQLGDVSVAKGMIEAMSSKHFMTGCTKIADAETCTTDKASLWGAQKAATDHASNLAGEAELELYKKTVAEEQEPEMKKYMEERQVRLEAKVECKSDSACWAGKLKDKNALIRERAAWELGRIKDAAAEKALTEALGDENTFVRSAAIAAYWGFGGKSAAPVVEEILKKEAGSATYVRVNQDLKRLLVQLQRAS